MRKEKQKTLHQTAYSDAEFWKRISIIPDQSTDCPDEEFFAAWLDGRLSGVEQQRMEAHLCCCSRCFHAARSLRQIMAASPGDIPCSLVSIHALVPSWKSGQEDRQAGLGWWTGAVPAVHAALLTVSLLLVVAGSLYLGGRMALEQRQFHRALMSELSFGLDDYHAPVPAG